MLPLQQQKYLHQWSACSWKPQITDEWSCRERLPTGGHSKSGKNISSVIFESYLTTWKLQESEPM